MAVLLDMSDINHEEEDMDQFEYFEIIGIHLGFLEQDDEL